MQIRKEALWAGFAMAPGYEAMITVCLLIILNNFLLFEILVALE